MNTRHSQRDPLILVVDEGKSMRMLLCTVMEQEGYRVIEAGSAEQCLAFFRFHPDVILLNAMMPGVDGLMCCVRLQKLSGNHPPVLIITSLNDQATIDRIFEVGATDYITKPIRLVVLRQRVRRLLQASQVMEELRQQTERERLLKAIVLKIPQSLDLDEILDTSATEIRAFLNVDRVAVYQIGPGQGGTFVVESVEPGWKPVLGTPLIDLCFDEEYAYQYQQGRVSATDDIYQAGLPACYIELLAQMEIRANLILPIVYQDELWGLLCAHHCSAARHWESFEIELLLQMANQMAIAIQQAKCYQQLAVENQDLQQLAALDGLTQVANRRHFDEYLEQEWRRMLRELMPLSLILGDIDHFKTYNDTYGHPAGDHCLQQVANTISEVAKRPADLVARYGGEEFAVILPNTRATGALELAEAIRSRLSAQRLVHANSQVSKFVTLSIGVASKVPRHTNHSAGLIIAADRALYQAKAQGRDRVILHILNTTTLPQTDPMTA